MATLFARETPNHCPADPVEKHRFLAAHALVHLVGGDATTVASGRGSGRPEFVVVIDADAPGTAGPVAEFSISVELPARVVADLAGETDGTVRSTGPPGRRAAA